MTDPADLHGTGEADIAIVGMAAHLPGANSVERYWSNLRAGLSSIRRLSEDELLEAGEAPGMIRRKDYVPFAAPLDGYTMFDAEFFGFSPKEAAILDPQHRRFLEVAWEAMESAGHVPQNFPGAVGVYGGCGMGSYFYFNICSNPDLVDQTGMFLLRHTGNDKDFLTTRASHVFDLKGPSMSLQTACSTSLVATHYAAQALLAGECDMALAGGVTIELPQGRGYVFKENEILSPDGECHAFDHRAAGTVFGSGAGVVVLRRLEDALADGDYIWAVIKGTAVNNDGADKAGYLAPSVGGQAAAISEAQAIADIDARSIGYVECHGTGTYLGDPIEVSALTQAFRETTDETGFCRIGSVKTNIGHLDTAAGVASLIKASLVLHHAEIPPSLGYEAPNPAIDFDHSPFRVNDRLTPWPETGHPRRAGVNSLGVGGTNAHVVLEAAPERPTSDEAEFPFQILTLSARKKAALDGNAARLTEWLRTHPEVPLADVAYTLKEGRAAFAERRIVVAESHEEAARLLESGDRRRVHSHKALSDPDVAFLLPGGGAQYPQMAKGLYETEPVFAEWMDRGLDHLSALTGSDPRAAWLAAPGAEAEKTLLVPSVQLPLILVTEIALARLWESWGVVPSTLIGHSMGENAAACLAGVMTFEEAIGLVHKRGSLFDTVPRGGMLSVALSEAALVPHLGGDLDIASINGAQLTVATGPDAALDALEKRLTTQGIECRRIGIDIAAHSRMLDPILPEFRAHLETLDLRPPEIPILSNRTGTWLTDEEATDPEYWVGHLRNTVRFADGVARVAETENRVLLEVGPGHALSALARQQPQIGGNRVVASLRHPDDAIADDRYFHEVLGRLWALGVEVDWDQVWGEARRHRVPLPTYAFQHASYFIEPGQAASADIADRYPARRDDMAEWGAAPVWQPRAAEVPVDPHYDLHLLDPETWLVFVDDAGLAAASLAPLRAAGHTVVEVRPGDTFARRGEHEYILAPERGREGYDLLLADLSARGLVPTRIAHFWLVTNDEAHRPGSSFFHRLQEQGFYSLLFLSQALVDEGMSGLHLQIFTNGAVQVRDEPVPCPVKATIAGPVRVIPREVPGLTFGTLDVTLPAAGGSRAMFGRRKVDQNSIATLASFVTEELLIPPGAREAALRGGRRFERALADRLLPHTPDVSLQGTILITGGFGGIARTLGLAAAKNGAKLVLVSRTVLPDRSDWSEYRRRHAPHDPVSRAIAHVEALEAVGAEVMVATADICDLAAMQDLVRSAEDRFGRINGVIHAAGRLSDQPFLALGPADVEDTFAPKLHGANAVNTLFPDGSVDWIALFSSVSTMAAAAGQLDYVAANEYLNAMAAARSGGATRVVALNWGIWAETGMAADALARRTGATEESAPEPANRPLLDTMRFDAAGRRVFAKTFSTSDWIIDEHRTRNGTALLPGSAVVTLAAHALDAAGEGHSFEIRDLAFLRPFIVTSGQGRKMTLRLSRTEAGYEMYLLEDARVQGKEGMLRFAEADIALRAPGSAPRLDLAAIRARMSKRETAAPGETLVTGQETHLEFGARWRVLEARGLSSEEGLAELALSPSASEDGCLVHPALFDIATGWAMDLISGYEARHLWVPLSYASIKVYGPLSDKVLSWVRPSGEARADSESASFDISLASPDGTVLVDIRGFAIRRLDDPAQLARAPRATAAELISEEGEAAAPLSPGEELLQHNLSQGIRPEEGAEAFARAMATGVPVLAVSPIPVHALKAQADTAARAETSNQSFERPDMDGEFAAPETEVEKRLAGFWAELLGVRNVGIDDSFFDLGGHSLIAVRLFSMVKKAYRVDFPISILFEAPTIRQCAALIAERAGISDGPVAEVPDRPTQTRPERRFSHIVQMHEGGAGSKTPFFLVAGMFGNVLNLRHLALLLGRDRPFYGLQAKGLYGDEAPHGTIEDAARDYIAEMKQVQPDGPYLVGGFSGGGITAYEIARQLTALGDEVALVAMLDTPLPQKRPLAAIDRAVIQLHEARRKGPLYPVIWARNRVRWEIEKRRDKGATESAETFHNVEIEAAFIEAIGRYQVAPYGRRVALFRPPLMAKWRVAGGRLVNHERAYLTHDNEWGGWASELEVVEVPGDHDSMVLEPNVRVLAAALKRIIEDAERGSATSHVTPFKRTEAAE
ncbi:type I polyketide synthase [Roseivivax sp. THAF30]|uniref:type I polyketide synthase n=1 Tax=Roseivivax sp. THAF30 TaxID=2587852 RepID=UPI0012681AFC|nr:type I polyketide synthase [Roseivivax sp. THAF30]QFT61383.1 Phthiocerol synthesis polyketide synthase type I PpsE [Roseivivax sp. THAF30]